MNDAQLKFLDNTKKYSRDRASDFGAKAYELCKGVGLEIGAVNCPFDVDADVRYLDQVGRLESLRRHDSDPNVIDVIAPDYVSCSLDYRFIDDGHFDFVIASHVLEHMINPGKAIAEFSRITAAGGTIYLVVPNKDLTFDKSRPLTPVAKLIAYYMAGTEKIALADYLEFQFSARDMNKVTLSDAERILKDSIADEEAQMDFHVQTFTPESFWNFVEWLAPHLGCELIYKHAHDIHIHAALRRVRGEGIV